MGINNTNLELKNKRVNEMNNNIHETQMKIIEYKDASHIIVEFQDEYKTKVKTRYEQFKKGWAANPYDKTVYNIGYLGEGIYNPKNNKNIYIVWGSMIKRCYDNDFHKKHTTYKGCTVCEEWLNFQAFGKWYETNFYQIKDEVMALDKDILFKGNKIYSPSTCVFVPQDINSLFVRKENYRGNTLIGVSYHKRDKVYQSQCNIKIGNKNKSIYLGSFNTELEAHHKYKTYKENLIKKVANDYKGKIPENLYNAMINYKIEMTD